MGEVFRKKVTSIKLNFAYDALDPKPKLKFNHLNLQKCSFYSQSNIEQLCIAIKKKRKKEQRYEETTNSKIGRESAMYCSISAELQSYKISHQIFKAIMWRRAYVCVLNVCYGVRMLKILQRSFIPKEEEEREEKKQNFVHCNK